MGTAAKTRNPGFHEVSIHSKLNLPMVLSKAEATRKSGIKDDRVLAFVLFICFVRPPSTLEIPRPQSFQVFCAKCVDRRGAQTIETS